MFLNFISNDRNLDTFKSLGSKLCSKFVNFFSIDLQIDSLETFGSESNWGFFGYYLYDLEKNNLMRPSSHPQIVNSPGSVTHVAIDDFII